MDFFLSAVWSVLCWSSAELLSVGCVVYVCSPQSHLIRTLPAQLVLCRYFCADSPPFGSTYVAPPFVLREEPFSSAPCHKGQMNLHSTQTGDAHQTPQLSEPYLNNACGNESEIFPYRYCIVIGAATVACWQLHAAAVEAARLP